MLKVIAQGFIRPDSVAELTLLYLERVLVAPFQ